MSHAALLGEATQHRDKDSHPGPELLWGQIMTKALGKIKRKTLLRGLFGKCQSGALRRGPRMMPDGQTSQPVERN
jgi:hypothetical protein